MPTFVVVAHENPQQVARLAARLAPYRTLIHINSRVDQAEFIRAARACESVEFLEDRQRVAVNWAGHSLTRAVNHLLAIATQSMPPDDHVVLLSGSDYPLKPIDEFAAFLREAEYRQHIRYVEVARTEDYYERHIARRNYRDVTLFPRAGRGTLAGKVNEAVRRSLSTSMRWCPPAPCPANLVPMRGCLWSALTAECAADVLERTTPEVDRWFARVFCADEMFLHTMVAAGPYASQVLQGGAEEYQGRGASRLSNFHLLHDSLNKWFTIDDLDEVAMSSHWFVRKVRPSDGGDLCAWLDDRAGFTD